MQGPGTRTQISRTIPATKSKTKARTMILVLIRPSLCHERELVTVSRRRVRFTARLNSSIVFHARN